MTYAGRLQLLNSILFHYQVYWSNIFLLPKFVTKQIDALCRSYLWTGQIDKSPMALLSWENVCVPKTKGGISIKQIFVWNKDACAKLLWKILVNPCCLWTKWASTVYLRGRSLWRVNSRQDDPWSWKKLFKLRAVFSSYITTCIGEGRQTSLFYDSWLPNGRIVDRINTDTAVWGSDLVVQKWRYGNGE